MRHHRSREVPPSENRPRRSRQLPWEISAESMGMWIKRLWMYIQRLRKTTSEELCRSNMYRHGRRLSAGSQLQLLRLLGHAVLLEARGLWMVKLGQEDLSLQKSLYRRTRRSQETPSIPKDADQQALSDSKERLLYALDENHRDLPRTPITLRLQYPWQGLQLEAPCHLTEASQARCHTVDPIVNQQHRPWQEQMSRVVCPNPNPHGDMIYHLQSCKMSLSLVNLVSPKPRVNSPESQASKQEPR